jgi:hypothetical protein
MRRLLLLSLILVSIMGCKSDPYPVEGSYYSTPPVETEPREGLSADLPKEIVYKEGILTEKKFRFAVPEPFDAIVEVRNLPAGATYNYDTHTLSWTPGYFDGNDIQDPSIKVRTYSINVRLYSSDEERNDSINENIVLIVNDMPRGFTFTGSDNTSVTEGSLLNYEFDINNADFPNGPFQVVSSGFPVNTKIEKISDNRYALKFTPDHYHVSINDRCNYSTKGCLEYNGKLLISNPAGHLGEKEVRLRVRDSRLPAVIEAPAELTQGLDVSFQVAAYDMNKEIAPDIQMISSTPGFGHFSSELVKNHENNSSVLNITLSDIPPTNNGKTLLFDFKACVKDSSANTNNCVNGTSKIKIALKDRKPPVIRRKAWPVGKMQYLDFDKINEYKIVVRDGEDPKLSPKVKIFPKSIRENVKWKNNKLTLKFTEAGVYQFNLVATSDYNVQSSESFLVEVFPETRSRYLVFADATRDREMMFL